MEELIIRYLWVTAMGTALVLAMPWLVIFGLFALIVPGLILALMPTAFAYGAVFALAWFPLHRALGDRPAALVAATIALAVFWALPGPGNAATRARYLAERAGDLLPAAPIALRGDVRLDARRLHAARERGTRAAPAAPPDYAKARCSPLCAALLFTEGVTSVTTQSEQTDARGVRAVSPRAVTFRLVPRDGCPAPIEPSFGHDDFGDGPLRALADAWALRLSTTHCIVAGPPLQEADLTVVASRYTTPLPATTRGGHASLGARPVGVERLELFDRGGQLLLRHTVTRASRVARPLLVAPEGRGAGDFRFRLATSSFERKHEAFEPVALLAAHTTLATRADDEGLAEGVRANLTRLLDDPAVPAADPGFRLVERFLRSMAAGGAPPEDVALLLRLIADDRVTHFDAVWDVARALGPRLEELRAPIVARLRRADPARERSLRALGDVLGGLPAGSFAALRRDEGELIADLSRHELASAIIQRQADRGADAVPLLARILDVQLRRLAALTADGPAHAHLAAKESARSATGAVRVALCRLGPVAGGALPTIEALERERLFGRLADDRDWQLTLARLGRPVDAIPKPANLSGSEANFRARLRGRLDRFDPARDCRG